MSRARSISSPCCASIERSTASPSTSSPPSAGGSRRRKVLTRGQISFAHELLAALEGLGGDLHEQLALVAGRQLAVDRVALDAARAVPFLEQRVDRLLVQLGAAARERHGLLEGQAQHRQQQWPP